jgi:gliding motility-associated-like protein
MVSAQVPEFNMSDTTVTDCDGYLFDSGGPDLIYAINEDLTFTINSGGPITISFQNEFCVENNLDFLYVYDGNSIAAPLIGGPFTGTNLPPAVTANSGAITIHFTSDQSVGYCGFTIYWDTQAPPPVPPVPSVPNLPACGSSAFQVQFSSAIPCTAINEASVELNADVPIAVQSFTALNCVNDSATSATLVMGTPFEYNCNYTLDLEIGLYDICDSLWMFDLQTTFLYDLCPPDVEVFVDNDSICVGECTNIGAIVNGCLNYSYSWNNGLPASPGPHEVCPLLTTTYTVTVTESQTGLITQESVTVYIADPEIVNGDVYLCQSEDAFFLVADPPGGTWEGPGIQDEISGLFEPDSANAGINIINYTFGPGCVGTTEIDIEPIDAGLVLASCPGNDPFQLEASPAGGVWSGPNVSPDGIFDPATEGNYIVTYTVNGCDDDLPINVGEIIAAFSMDTVCQSVLADTLGIEPFGGIWSGPGIIDTLYGIFDPGEAPAGDITLYYNAVGCDQLFDVFVKEIFIGDKWQNACPEEPAFELYPGFIPPSGIWEGLGITDVNNGIFDPSIPPDDSWNTLLYHAPNGCTDTIFMYVKQTEIFAPTQYFCEDDDLIYSLQWETISNTPWGGVWTGPGIFNPVDEPWLYGFDPAIAGIGNHLLNYNANGCEDTIRMVVHPIALNPQNFTFCTNDEAMELFPGQPPGIVYSGPGIADETSSIFDPALAGPGNHTLYWNSPAGCGGEFYVEVEQFEQASIAGLDEEYCFINLDIPIELYPNDGVLSGGDGIGIFNPSLAGEGSHTLIYTWTGSYCASADTFELNVLPQLLVDLEASDLFICEGQSSVLNATASGGVPGVLYSYSWNEGLFPISTVTAIPEATTTYIVTASDGCSDNALDSVLITILQPVTASVFTSDTLCFGEDGFANALPDQAGDFSITWDGEEGETIEAPAGSIFELVVSDLNEGCSFDTLVTIPSYSAVIALFSINPDMECIPYDDNPVSFIDLSQNALEGAWVIGNDTIPYIAGSPPTLSFEPGNYTAELVVFNEGSCKAEYILDFCVLPSTRIFVPDIFSPNGDGNNDELFVRGQGIVSMDFRVYNRWGELVHNAVRLDDGWNGSFRGMAVPSGVLAYTLKALLNDGEVIEMSGNITLLR